MNFNDRGWTTKDILYYAIEILVMAALYGLFAFFVIYGWLAGGNLLLSYLYNMVFVALLIFLQKALDHFVMTHDTLNSIKNVHVRKRVIAVLYFLEGISFKTVLYVFYMFALILAKVAVLEPELIHETLKSFLMSIEYGLILVVTFDKFMDQVAKDDKRATKIFAQLDKWVGNRVRAKKKTSDEGEVKLFDQLDDVLGEAIDPSQTKED